ncbi:protein HGH1 [Populus alba x Populus x berolinensis]|uniref:Protein HGH1 n=1 Tax=Populus alba x Populus x berolinensis TaxID=444605 RepID=A0AAD6PPH6_9ROSI|nr:protein HGH1 [Populus alba x Populus x berolinensis]
MGKLCKNIERSMESMRKEEGGGKAAKSFRSSTPPLSLSMLHISLIHLKTVPPSPAELLKKTAEQPWPRSLKNWCLSSPSPPVKKAAVEIVRDLTGSEDGSLSLSKHASTVLPSLSQLLKDKKDVSEPAAEALINLSLNSNLAAKMVEMGMIKTAMDIEDEKMQGLFVMKLVRSFCRSSDETRDFFASYLLKFIIRLSIYYVASCLVYYAYFCMLPFFWALNAMRMADDPFNHVGSILVNISKKEAGRKIGLLKQILRQFDSTSPLRKEGVFGTLRNCCFEAENQLQNLLLISEFLWPALLLPVAGKKIYSEDDASKMPLELGNVLSFEREPWDDPEIRVEALESIYLITVQEAGLRAFWSVNGPRIYYKLGTKTRKILK